MRCFYYHILSTSIHKKQKAFTALCQRVYCVFFHFHFFYKTCKTCQKVVVVKWKKKVRLNISILCKVTSLGTFKQLSSPVCPLYSFIERSRKKGEIVVCTSLLLGKALMKLLEFLAKNGSWQQPSRNCIFAFALQSQLLSFPFCSYMLQPLEKLEEIEAYSKQLFSDQQKESFAKRISVTTIRTSATAPCVKKYNGLKSIIFYLQFFVSK